MSVSQTKSVLLPAVMMSGAIFCALTAPLAVVGSEPIDIQVQDEPVFSGELKDIAAPYVGLAGAIALGAGIASFSVSGWRQSSSKSAQIEDQLSGLKDALKAKESELDELKLSDSRLRASGLDFFLQDESAEAAPMPKPAAERPVQPTQQPAPSFQSLQPTVPQPQQVRPSRPLVAKQAAGENPVAMQVAVSSLPPAQAFLSFTQTNTMAYRANGSPAATATKPEVEVFASQMGSEAVTLDHVNDVHNQMKQLMDQLETLKGSLQKAPQFSSATN